MVQRNSPDPQDTLLGMFVASKGASCYVLDWGYSSNGFEYEYVDEDEGPQLIMSEDYPYGALPAGIHMDISLSEHGEVPVYIERVDEALTRVIVAIDRWVRPGQEPATALPADERAILTNDDTEQPRRREALGSVTASADGILVTEIDFLDACRRYGPAPTSQITIPPDNDDQEPLHIGVLVGLTPQRPDQEFPVFCDYEGERLTRIVVEITDVMWHR